MKHVGNYKSENRGLNELSLLYMLRLFQIFHTKSMYIRHMIRNKGE